MSSHIRKIKGTNVLFEIEDPNDDSPTMMSSRGAKEVDTQIDKAFDIIHEVAKPFVNTWEELNKKQVLDGAEVEIGLGFSVEGNFFIAKSEVSASIKVTLKISSQK